MPEVMTDDEFARFLGPHPLRIGDQIRRSRDRVLRFRRNNYEPHHVQSSGTVVDVEEDGFIVRWNNTMVRRWFWFRDEGKAWIREAPPDVLPPPSPWVPPRKILGCCADRRYHGASRSCTERTCMHLPVVGQTCADCVHVNRCKVIFGQRPDDTACQFFPRRFLARRSPAAYVASEEMQR